MTTFDHRLARRVLALFMAFALVVGMVPLQAFAEEAVGAAGAEAALSAEVDGEAASEDAAGAEAALPAEVAAVDEATAADAGEDVAGAEAAVDEAADEAVAEDATAGGAAEGAEPEDATEAVEPASAADAVATATDGGAEAAAEPAPEQDSALASASDDDALETQSSTGIAGGCTWYLSDAGTLAFGPAYTGLGYGYGELNISMVEESLRTTGLARVKKIIFKSGVYTDYQDEYQLRTLFSIVPNLTEVDVSGLDISRATDLRELFKGCTKLTKVTGMSSLDTSGVYYFGSMFEGCTSLQWASLVGLDTSQVCEMISMFEGCKSLVAVNLTGIDTSGVFNTSSMFSGCSKLTAVKGLANLDMDVLQMTSEMFSGCSSLKTLELFRCFTLRACTKMFYGCSRLADLDLSGLCTLYVYDGNLSNMLAGCKSLEYLTVGGVTNFKGASVPAGLYYNIGDGTWKSASGMQSASAGNLGGTWRRLPFTDVGVKHWAKYVIMQAVDYGLMHGYSSSKFGPNDKVKRCDAAVVLWNMAGKPKATNAKKFSDVSKGAYYYTAVSWASGVGVVNGYGGARKGKFGPDDFVTREQLAVMLANYVKKYEGWDVSGASAAYKKMGDWRTVSLWARPAIAWCFDSGIMSGSGGKIKPQDNATRAEAAKMFVYLYEMLEDD